MTSPLQQNLLVKNRLWRRFEAQPISIGLPWPEGRLKSGGTVSLLTQEKRPVPVGVEVLNRWPDGSIQWTLLDFAADLKEGEEKRFVVASEGHQAPAPRNPVVVRKLKNSLRVGNGLVELEVASSGRLVRRWAVNGRAVVSPGQFDLVITDLAGKSFRASKESRRKLTVEHANALRTVVRIDGKHADGSGSTLIDYWLKLTVWAGRTDVRISYHFRNRERVVPSVKVKTIQVILGLNVPTKAERSITHANRGRQYWLDTYRLKDDFEILSSDCVEIDQYAQKHKNGGNGECFVRQGEVLHDDGPDMPWFMRNLAFRGTGREKCVWPYLALRSKEHCLVFAGGNMVGLHPKSLRISGNALTYSIWPDWAGELEIRQGAGKTHELYLSALPARASDVDFQTQYLSWEHGATHSSHAARSPVEIIPDIQWIRSCRVFKVHLTPEYDPKQWFRLERKIGHSWFGVGYGGSTYLGSGPAAPNGMWHYGDSGIGGNNEEMVFQTFLQDYLRSGRWANAERGLAGCQHLIDVDYVDFSIYPYQRHGMCAHCPDHNNGAVYPSHEWFNELFIAYAISGEPEFKRAALHMCENLLYWINTPGEFRIVANDMREAGQPMINLAWAYEFNPDPRYVEACKKIWRDGLAPNVRRYGRMVDGKPHPEMPVTAGPYGDYATWQGLFWLWDLTRDEELRKLYLEQCRWRLTEEYSGTAGWMRCTDYNVAAFAYYASGGDRSWLDRVARPFQACFSAAGWNIGWMHSIYYMKLALDYGIVKDSDVTLQ